MPEQAAPSGRRAVRLPRDIAMDLRRVCRASGDVAGQLIRGWLDDAVVRACSGQPLPARSTVPAGGDTERFQWPQSDDEYRLWSELIEACGSSVRAVVAERAELHVQARGNRAAARMLIGRRYSVDDARRAQRYQEQADALIRRVLESGPASVGFSAAS